MTIYRQKTKSGKEYGTFRVERRVLGKRLKLTTGTKLKTLAREMENIILDLRNQGLDSKLQALVSKKVSLRQLHKQKTDGTLFVPTIDPVFATPLKPALTKWMIEYPNWSVKTRKNNIGLVDALWKRLPSDLHEPLIHDIPKVLKFYSDYNEREQTNRYYNLTRAVLSRFVSKNFGTLPILWAQVVDVKTLPNQPKSPLRAKTPAEIERLCRHLKPKYEKMIWTMCCTGVGWDEYGKLSPSTDIANPRVTILGTKMDKKDGRRRREVPLVFPPEPRVGTNQALAQALKVADKKAKLDRVRPYTFRKCYSVWAREAGIPEWRVELYMGHSPKSMTAKYQTSEIWTWLRDDGKRLREWINEERKKIGRKDYDEGSLPQQQPFSFVQEDR